MYRLIIILSIFACIFASPAPKGLPGRNIIGGSKATIGQIPYQVSVLFDKIHICGGALIAPNVVITVAHCTHGRNISLLSVVAGSLKWSEGGVRIGVDRIVEEPKFIYGLYEFDIAIVLLKRNFTLGRTIRTINLPNFEEKIPEWSTATISGWGIGSKEANLRYVEDLNFVNVLVWDNKCKDVVKLNSPVYCAGVWAGKENGCHGDSGGPLVYKNKLFGILASGYGCGTPLLPVVYTNVGKYQKWISDTTGLFRQ